ncbi:MAG TPA: hypothetical protein VG321_07160 [Solirubrobacteraceae bacterium]|jgi:hypothetical protein|nr:hypothetical protein [Solirubrobacteraceae bacterium]
MSVTTGRVSSPEQTGDEFSPGVYVTDGTRLFRVISPGQSLFPSAELEDCETLEVDRYFSDELYAMHLHRVPSPTR